MRPVRSNGPLVGKSVIGRRRPTEGEVDAYPLALRRAGNVRHARLDQWRPRGRQPPLAAKPPPPTIWTGRRRPRSHRAAGL